jgi:hypothetical protein
MKSEEFLQKLQAYATSFAKAVATNEGEWIGEEVYDDYWMFYLTRDMSQALAVQRPYTNLKTYLEYKEKGIDILKAHEKEIAKLAEEEPAKNEEETE